MRSPSARLAAILALILLPVACSRRGPTSSAPPAAAAQVPPSAAPGGSVTTGGDPTHPPAPPAPAASASSSAVVKGPAVIVPPIPPHEQDMMDHLPASAGWSKDGAALGYCVGLAVHLGCSLQRPNGTTDGYDDNNGDNAASSAAFEKRIAAIRFRGNTPGEWAYAGELEITWRVTQEDCNKTPHVASRVDVGARVPGEPASYPIRLAMAIHGDVCYGSAHPEMIGVSPDGKYLGAIGHGFAGEWMNDYPTDIVPVTVVAERAFNDAGLAHHKKADYARAAELFRKATRADPTSKAAAYNLACALARLGAADTEGALRAAIALGGDETRTSARNDADFEGVSAAPWFVALVQ